MHAYLIVGENTEPKIKETVMKLKGSLLEFPISKIDEVRHLNNFLKNTQPENTIILCRDVDESTIDSLNAFLKSLEEPQKNISFILTAKNEFKVLPTITSRCQVIRAGQYAENEDINILSDFLNMDIGQKLLMLDKIKNRIEAKSFLQSEIKSTHQSLKNENSNYKLSAIYLEALEVTLKNINANGNVSLQLTNLIVNLNRLRKASLTS